MVNLGNVIIYINFDEMVQFQSFKRSVIGITIP